MEKKKIKIVAKKTVSSAPAPEKIEHTEEPAIEHKAPEPANVPEEYVSRQVKLPEG